MKSVNTLIKLAFKEGNAPWFEAVDGLEQKLFDFTTEHGLIPMLCFQHSETDCCSDWPDSLMSKLQGMAKLELVLEQVRERELIKVLKYMNGVTQPILLKGTPLSYSIYPKPGLRPRCDTDFLIDRNSIEKVVHLMERQGYQPLYEGRAEYISSQMTFYKYGDLRVFHAFDIHWQISNNRRKFSEALNYNYLLKNSLKISKLGENVKTLNTVDALLLACYHRAGHFSEMGDRLIWLYDIHLLVENLKKEESDSFFRRAIKLEILAISSDAIFTAKEWFGTEINEAFELQLSQQSVEDSSRAFLQQDKLEGIRVRSILEIRQLSTGYQRFFYIAQKAFPPINYMVWRYGITRKYLIPFYYFYRVLYGLYVFLSR